MLWNFEILKRKKKNISNGCPLPVTAETVTVMPTVTAETVTVMPSAQPTQKHLHQHNVQTRTHQQITVSHPSHFIPLLESWKGTIKRTAALLPNTTTKSRTSHAGRDSQIRGNWRPLYKSNKGCVTRCLTARVFIHARFLSSFSPSFFYVEYLNGFMSVMPSVADKFITKSWHKNLKHNCAWWS